MIDQPAADDGDGLEAAVGVLREAGDDIPVIHAPAVLAGKVLTQRAPRERGRRPEVLVACRIGVVVVDAKEKRVDAPPREAERPGFEDGATHGFLSACGRDARLEHRTVRVAVGPREE